MPVQAVPNLSAACQQNCVRVQALCSCSNRCYITGVT
jgi:hypothetical protein